jgi:uncharacterized protein YlxW (UPF0749 family)
MSQERDHLILREVTELRDDVECLKADVSSLVAEVMALRQFLDQASRRRAIDQTSATLAAIAPSCG